MTDPPKPAHGVAASYDVRALAWPEIVAGDDLGARLASTPDLRDGDIMVVTSKVVSKAEGRLRQSDRARATADETRRVVARRRATVIAETRHGLVMAAAGVDASNTPVGTALLLPIDPDASARRLRTAVQDLAGVNVGVVISDTAGRAWRIGQTDIAIGCAGLAPMVDLAGTTDPHGNPLVVTQPAVADEIAAAADLAKGKTTGRPLAVVRGLAALVLPVGADGPGAQALIRSSTDDLFGLGSRDAIRAAALRDDPEALHHVPPWDPADGEPFDGLLDGWESTVDLQVARDDCPDRAVGTPTWSLRIVLPRGPDVSALLAAGRVLERADVLAAAYGLARHEHRAPPPEEDGRRLALVCWQPAV